MMERALLLLPRASIAWPRLALGLVGALALIGAAGIVRLELRTDGHALVPPGNLTTVFDAAVRHEFGLRDPILVYLETTHPDGIYNLDTMRRVQELSDRLSGLDGVGREQVMSLATEASPRVHPGTFDFRTFLDPPPDTPKRMAQLRKDIAEVGILTGTLVSADASATAILVGAPRPVAIDAAGVDRAALYREILDAARPFETELDQILVVGAPVAEALLGSHILEDLTLLVPLSMLIIALVIWLGCRRLWGVALALGEVGACLLFTLGAMGWNGAPVYLTTAVLPVILTTIGLADEIHILWHYQRVLGEEPTDPGPSALTRTMAELVRPITLTSVTTAVGFLSFLAAPIVPVQSFGIYAALGIGFCWLWSLVAMPAALALLGPEAMRHPSRAGGSMSRAGEHLMARLLARPERTLRALLLATAAIGLGALGLHVQDSWIDGFAAESPFRLATERVDAQLHGTHVLLAHLDLGDVDPRDGAAPDRPGSRGKRGDEGRPQRSRMAHTREGRLIDPAVLDAIGEFEAYLRDRDGVGGVLGPYSHLVSITYLVRARTPEGRKLPGDRRSLDKLIEYFDTSRGKRRRREVIQDDLRRTVVTILIKNANYRDTARLMRAIREYQGEHLDPMGIRVDFAGDIAVSQAMIPAIVRTQLGSMVLAVAGVFLVAALLMGSLRMALWTVLPTGLAVVWMLGAMGWLGIPIGVATSTFCAITLGIGVDYAIHFLDRIRRADAVGHPDRVARAVREAAPAIGADALAVALGFGVLGLSQVPANARLGSLVAVALVAAATLTLVGLAALLAAGRWPPGIVPGWRAGSRVHRSQPVYPENSC